MEKAYTKSVEELAANLNTDIKTGLTSQEAQHRLKKFGPNVLKEEKGKNPLLIFYSQFTSFLVIILIIASIISYLLGQGLDALMILAVVAINAVLGFIQEYRAEEAIKHLKKLVTANVQVRRDGGLLEIPHFQLVPGDLVVISDGQKVPADIRVTQSISLRLNEAPLTGESTPVTKATDILSLNTNIADQKNMLFAGTTVSSGKGMGIVVSTGMTTEIGKIAHLVSQQVEPITPLKQKLDRLGKLLGRIVLIIASLIALEQIILGEQVIEAFISSVALAVAAIPEGLPAIVTISLALGTKRLLKHHALIRNLPASETLGSTDVICTDKTGTLTEGRMTVRQVYGDNRQKILQAGVLASNARASGEKIVGDPTEAALIQEAISSGVDQDQLDKKFPRVQEIPFSSDRKMMTTICQEDNQYWVISKGATEVILDKCSHIEEAGKVIPLTEEKKEQILKVNEKMASGALRILAFAEKRIPAVGSKIESDLIFLGLQGMIDPPRKGVKEAIEVCQKQAGIKVVMITGDHLLTAQAIAKEVGIIGEGITGTELDKLSDDQFKDKVDDIAIYARVNPEHKLKIVKALKAHEHQVAMTGDGVNDAPALKSADVGVAMGISGTDVAKEASDMILLDDNFLSIVQAIKEGRAIFDNIRKFVNYLLSSNTMEVMVISLAVILGGGHLPLLPIHLLWINLVTDGLPALALGVDPPRADIMTLPPKNFRQQILDGKSLAPLTVVSVLLTIAILAIFFIYQKDPVYEQTMVFSAIVFYEMLRIIAIRSEYKLPFFSNIYLVLAIAGSLILQLMILYLPFSFAGFTLQELFKVTPLHIQDWVLLLGVGIFLLFVMRILVVTPLFNFFRKT